MSPTIKKLNEALNARRYAKLAGDKALMRRMDARYWAILLSPEMEA